MVKKSTNYQELNDELSVVLATLQQDDLDIDVAIKAYERGSVLVSQIEEYLTQAQNKVTILKNQASS